MDGGKMAIMIIGIAAVVYIVAGIFFTIWGDWDGWK